MSWDATLYIVTETAQCGECGHALDPPKRAEEEAGWWNYTHNCSVMIYAVLEDAGIVLPPSTRPCTWLNRETGEWVDAPEGHGTISWWEHLDGMDGADGADGAAYLSQIITGLEADPERFRVMNPENGWGDYDSLVKVLREMRDAAVEIGRPAFWRVSG